MAFQKNSDWSLNKDTPDIVYSFLDGTTKRYRKIEDRVYEVVENKVSCVSTTLIPTDEITAEQFDELKQWSDLDYQATDRHEVHHSRGQVPIDLVENTIKASATFMLDEEKDDTYSIENALHILENAKLTEIQRRRYEMAVRGLNTCEIAKLEHVDQKVVWRSLEMANRKIQKSISKTFQKQGLKPPKK